MGIVVFFVDEIREAGHVYRKMEGCKYSTLTKTYTERVRSKRNVY